MIKAKKSTMTIDKVLNQLEVLREEAAELEDNMFPSEDSMLASGEFDDDMIL